MVIDLKLLFVSVAKGRRRGGQELIGLAAMTFACLNRLFMA
jgi:hypothetical protein